MIDLKRFGGEVPLLPPSELPDYAAQQALFCDFAHGNLAPLKGGFLLGAMSNAVKSIYTEDGIYFYTWPTEAWPVKSPVMRDVYNRVYYLDAGVLRVTTTAGMQTNGGVPASSFKVGVPQPTVAPVLAIVDRTDLRDYPGATFALTVWWEFNGKRYQEATAALTAVTALRTYTFDAPVRDTLNTPSGAVVRATFKGLDSASKQFMTVTMTAGDTDARSNAVPGGITFAMTLVSGNQHRIELIFGISETRAYTYTARNIWLEESPPSPPSQIATTYLQDVQVTLTAVDFSGGYQVLDDYLTYRTVGASADYMRVKVSTDLVFTDSSSKAEDMLGVLETADYEAPPPLMDAMVVLPNGSLAGFKGTTLYISEVYRPHTWQYEIPFPKSVRGLLVVPGALIATTAEVGYAVIGSDPASMQPVPLPVPQAGISQRSMAKLPGQGVYASNDGFVSVVGSQASLAQSQALFARDNWQQRYGAVLTSMRFAHHDGALVATSSAEALGFVLRTDEQAAGQMTQFNVQMDSMFQLPAADSLYYSVGSNVYQFRGGSVLSYTWWSKDFVFATERNIGAGYIRCDGTVTLTFYADGEQVEQFTVTTGHFRLSSGYKRMRWSVKVQGTGAVYRLCLARTMGELKRV